MPAEYAAAAAAGAEFYPGARHQYQSSSKLSALRVAFFLVSASVPFASLFFTSRIFLSSCVRGARARIAEARSSRARSSSARSSVRVLHARGHGNRERG